MAIKCVKCYFLTRENERFRFEIYKHVTKPFYHKADAIKNLKKKTSIRESDP